MAPSVPVKDLLPTEMRDGALTVRDLEIHGTEQELLAYLVGEDADAAEIAVAKGIAESAGGGLDDMTIIDGWFALDDGTTQVNLGAFQIGGSETDDLRQSIHTMAMTWMDDPGFTEQEIAGRGVTVYDTAEEHGDYVNYLYVHDDIAWMFATFEEHASDVLEALPG